MALYSRSFKMATKNVCDMIYQEFITALLVLITNATEHISKIVSILCIIIGNILKRLSQLFSEK